MNILLTGGTGYIGSHTAVVLAQRGHNVVLFDNLSNSSGAVVERLALIDERIGPFVEGDVRDTARVKETLEAHNIDAVVHFAGLKVVGESTEKPIEYYANNVQGTLSLLTAMQTLSIKTLVFSSSANVYGPPEYLPVDEEHPTGTANPYGHSKLYAEEILADVARSDPDWGIICLRYFNPVGAHESALIGEDPKGIPNNLMPLIAQVAAGQRAELNIFGNDYETPDGTGVRDYIHVMDLAEGHAAALDFLVENHGWQAINLGTGHGYSVMEMIKAFEKASGRQIPFRVAPRRPADVASCFADPEKARRLLNWAAVRSLDEMCESTWKFQQSISLKNSV